MLAAAAMLAGCGGENRATTADAERAIKDGLPQKLRGPGITNPQIKAVSCAKKTESEARCVASVQTQEETADFAIDATLGEDGKVVWETDGTPNVQATAPGPEAAEETTGSSDVEGNASSTAGTALQEQTDRLEAAGLTVEEEEVSDAIAGISVDDVDISLYDSTSSAAGAASEIEGIFDETPGRGVVRNVSSRLYTLAQERQLTASEKAKFERIIRIAEGQ